MQTKWLLKVIPTQTFLRFYIFPASCNPPCCSLNDALMLTFSFWRAQHRQWQHHVCVGVPGGLAPEEAAVVAGIAPADVGVVLHAVDAQHCGGAVKVSLRMDTWRATVLQSTPGFKPVA